MTSTTSAWRPARSVSTRRTMRARCSAWTMAAYAQIVGAVRDGTDPIVASHGVDFFSYLAEHPDAALAFHDAMAAGARLQAVMIGDSLELAPYAGTA